MLAKSAKAQRSAFAKSTSAGTKHIFSCLVSTQASGRCSPTLTNQMRALIDMMKNYVIHAGATIAKVQCDDMRPALRSNISGGKGVSVGRRACKKPVAKRAPSPMPAASSSTSDSQQGSENPWYENDSDAGIDME